MPPLMKIDAIQWRQSAMGDLSSRQVVVRLCRNLILNTKTKSTVEGRDDSSV
jgi:hypothetical protein